MKISSRKFTRWSSFLVKLQRQSAFNSTKFTFANSSNNTAALWINEHRHRRNNSAISNKELKQLSPNFASNIKRIWAN